MPSQPSPFVIGPGPQAPGGQPVTVVLTCRGRLHHLRQSLPLLAAQSSVATLVVDDACPDGAADWVRVHWPATRVVQIDGGAHFSVARARNMGARQVTTPWVCFMDADTLVGPDFQHGVLPLLQDASFFLADPCPRGMTGLVICRLEDFARIGGYDEVFAGWGCEDIDLYARLVRSGCRPRRFPAAGIRVLPHDDTERTRHHAITDRLLAQRINGLYFQIKNDLARLSGTVDLARTDRELLYASVRNKVLAAPDASTRIEITLPGNCDFEAPPGWRLRRTIHYSFDATGATPLP